MLSLAKVSTCNIRHAFAAKPTQAFYEMIAA